MALEPEAMDSEALCSYITDRIRMNNYDEAKRAAKMLVGRLDPDDSTTFVVEVRTKIYPAERWFFKCEATSAAEAVAKAERAYPQHAAVTVFSKTSFAPQTR